MKPFDVHILNWYDKNKLLLPWRKSTDPYKIWVSEIMLQQTQVQTVIPFYNKWIKSFPTLKSVAHASDQKIFKHWEGLGYYKRAEHLRLACIQLLENYNGVIPESKKELMLLKGIGEYTSSAISSIAFNKVHPVIDGNVRRIISRLLCLSASVLKSDKEIMIFLKTVINQHRPGDFNQAIMELGQKICRPQNPECQLCPIATFCQSYKMDCVSEYPKKEKKKKGIPHYNIGVGIIWHKGSILITKRKKNGLLGGLWEFPGGKIYKNESIEECIKREIKEELSIEVDVADFITKVNHRYSHFSITLYAHNCYYKKGKIKCNSADDWKWISPGSFDSYPFPKANHYIFPKINHGIGTA